MIDANLILCDNQPLEISGWHTLSENIVDLSSIYDPGEGFPLYVVTIWNVGFNAEGSNMYGELFIESSKSKTFPPLVSTKFVGSALNIKRDEMFTGMRNIVSFNPIDNKYQFRYIRLRVKTPYTVRTPPVMTSYCSLSSDREMTMYSSGYTIFQV